MMFSRQYLNIRYLWPLLAVLLFVCSPTYVCFNIAYHQTSWPLGGLCHIILQHIHVLAFHWPNGWKIIMDQIIAKNWKGFWHGQVLIIQITLGNFFLHVESCSSRCRGKFNLFLFIYTFFLYKCKSFMC